MHFLSHYYIDRALDNPYFVAGALLPDISPHFTKTYNRQIRNKTYLFDEPMASIHAGVLRHYEVDAAFHGASAFRDICHKVSEAMIAQGLDRQRYRLWFLSHIASEVMIDKVLMERHSEMADNYYTLLSSVEINKIYVYLKTIDPNGESNRILTNFERFADVKFLYHMINTEGAAEGITRTAHKATGVQFSDIDRRKLIAALDNIETEIRYSTEILLDPDLYRK